MPALITVARRKAWLNLESVSVCYSLMQFHSQLIWIFAVEQSLWYLISLLQVKKEMCIHESALLLNSFQSYQTKDWVLSYFAMKKERCKMCLLGEHKCS